MLNKAKAKEPPRLHFAILLVSHGLRPFEEGKGPVKWDMITMAKIQTWCKKKKDANPGWHPHLFEVPLDMYIDATPAKKRWWLLPPLVVAPPILVVAPPAPEGTFDLIKSFGDPYQHLWNLQMRWWLTLALHLPPVLPLLQHPPLQHPQHVWPLVHRLARPARSLHPPTPPALLLRCPISLASAPHRSLMTTPSLLTCWSCQPSRSSSLPPQNSLGLCNAHASRPRQMVRRVLKR